jgi:hypothetical protein
MTCSLYGMTLAPCHTAEVVVVVVVVLVVRKNSGMELGGRIVVV